MVSTPMNVKNDVDVDAVFTALELWIKQRPGLDPANYGLGIGQSFSKGQWKEAYHAYNSELRSIAKDRQRAMKALDEARGLNPQKPELLMGAFRAFSGRLQLLTDWNGASEKCASCAVYPMTQHKPECTGGLHDVGVHLLYTTGQYWPTEYRKAAASVLETYIADWKQAYAAEHPQEFVYHDMEDVKAANRQIGHHWFDRGTMRFFNTKVESGLIGGKYFITSERMETSHPKKYSVRRAEPDGTIDTVGEFCAYHDKAGAREAIRELMTGSQK